MFFIINFIILIGIYFNQNNLIAQSKTWTSLNGPKGTYVTKIHKSTQDSLIIASFSGIYSLNKAGSLWQKLSEIGFNNEKVFDFCETPSNGIFAIGELGVYKTINRKTWINSNNNLNFNFIGTSQIVFEPIRKELWLASSDFLAFSKDFGDSWTKVKLSTTDSPNFITIDLNNNLVVSLKDSSIVSIYNPVKNEWKNSSPIKLKTEFLKINFIYPEKNDLYWGIAKSLDGRKILYKSIDGIDWVAVNEDSNIDHLLKSPQGYLGVSQDDGIIYESKDEGKSWKAVYGTPYGNKIFIGSSFSNKIIWGTEQLGFLIYDFISSEFKLLDMGLITPNFTKTMLLPEDAFICCAIPSYGISISRDKGKNWEISNKGLGSLAINSLFAWNSDTLLASFAGKNKLYLTDNSGLSWKVVPLEDSIGIFKEFCKSSNDKVIAISNSMVSFSMNRGLKWETLKSPIENCFFEHLISLGNDSICVSTQEKGIWLYTFKNSEWKKLSGGIDESFVAKIRRNNFDGSLWATNSMGIYKWNGSIWDIIRSIDLGKEIINSFNFDTEGHLYLSMISGKKIPSIYRSKDGGKTLINIKDNLINDYVLDISFDKSNNIYATTWGDGIFTRYFPISRLEEDISHKISLYPNPSNGIFTLSKDDKSTNFEKTQIEIFNVLGSKVAPEISSKLNQLTINLVDYPSGYYHIKIVSMNFEKYFTLIKQ